jgi:dihydropteroate synthase
VSKKKIIIDPGIGFGKTVAHNLALIHRLAEFHALGLPVLLGSSRKAFIRNILGEALQTKLTPDHPAVETGTQATAAAGIFCGAHILRVHDVAGTFATVKIVDAIRSAY